MSQLIALDRKLSNKTQTLNDLTTAENKLIGSRKVSRLKLVKFLLFESKSSK